MANLKTNVNIYIGISLFCSIWVMLVDIIYIVKLVRPGAKEEDERKIVYDYSQGEWPFSDITSTCHGPSKKGTSARCKALSNRTTVAAVAFITALAQLILSIAMLLSPIKFRVRIGFYIFSGILVFLSALYLVCVIINTGPYVYVQYDYVFGWIALYETERNTYFVILNTFLVLAVICCWTVSNSLSVLTFAFKNNVGYLPSPVYYEQGPRVIVKPPIVVNKAPPKKTIYV